jgi:hypothetical protein
MVRHQLLTLYDLEVTLRTALLVPFVQHAR